MRLLRSMLFAPGNNPHRMVKAATFRPDAVILDLEDSVPPAEKEAARDMVAAAIGEVAATGMQVFVRLNALDSGWTEADVEAAVHPDLAGLVLPKVGSAADVQRVAMWVARWERECDMPPGSVALAPQIESAAGVLEARAIAAADPRIIALLFGALDLTRDLGATLTLEGLETLYARSHVVLCAAAAGIVAIDSPYIDIADRAGLVQQAQMARQLGFAGKLCIHPDQIGPVNAAFSPGEQDIAEAQELLAAFEAAQAQGLGAIRWRGKMVDAANANQARALLDLARRLAQ